MGYGNMLRRLKQVEAREGRRVERARAATGHGAPRSPRREQTPAAIILAALDEGRRA